MADTVLILKKGRGTQALKDSSRKQAVKTITQPEKLWDILFLQIRSSLCVVEEAPF